MTKIIGQTFLAILLGAILSIEASAQGTLELDPSVVTLEPGDNYSAASIGSIQGLASGVYFLAFEQTGSLQLQNLGMSVNGINLASGSQFFFSGTAQLGLSFFIPSDAAAGQSAVITVQVLDILGRRVGVDSMRVEIRVERTCHLACFRTHNGMHHVVSEADIVSVNADRTRCLSFEVHQVIDLDGGELEDGDSVAILPWHGRYWSGQPNGQLQANRSDLLEWERFELRKVGGNPNTPVERGDTFALRTFHGRWVVAEQGGGNIVQANRPVPSTWETFTFLSGAKTAFCLQAHNSQFVASEGNPGSVNAKHDSCTGQTVHELTDINAGELHSGDTVYVKTQDNRYWSAQPDGELTADRPNAGPWERFVMVRISGSSGALIQAGDEIALRSVHNRWVVAEDGGGRELASDREVPSIWETFVYRPQ